MLPKKHKLNSPFSIFTKMISNIFWNFITIIPFIINPHLKQKINIACFSSYFSLIEQNLNIELARPIPFTISTIN